MESRKNRVEWVDIAKGIGIIFVIAGHLFVSGSIVSCIIFSFHMPLFFFLSGIFFNPKGDLIRKIELLLISFLKYLIIGFIFTMIIQPFATEKFSLRALARDLYCGSPNSLYIGQIWFLIALIWVNLFMHVVMRVFKHRSQWVILVPIFIGGGYLLERINSFLPCGKFPLMLDTSVMATVFFMLGFLMKDRINDFLKISSRVTKIILLTNATILICMSKINGWVNIGIPSYNNIFLYLAFALIGIAWIILLSDFLSGTTNTFFVKIKKILSITGKNSLFCFAIHSIPLYIYCYILKYTGVDVTGGVCTTSFIYSVIGTIVVFVPAFGLMILCKKIENH